jgi:hypothetical protein
MGSNRHFFTFLVRIVIIARGFFIKCLELNYLSEKYICYVCGMATSGVIGRFKVILWAVLRFFLHFKSG